MRPFALRDFEPALALEQDAAAARWVPELPAADAAGVVAFYDACRRCDGERVERYPSSDPLELLCGRRAASFRALRECG